jgi:hypothetical protein
MTRSFESLRSTKIAVFAPALIALTLGANAAAHELTWKDLKSRTLQLYHLRQTQFVNYSQTVAFGSLPWDTLVNFIAVAKEKETCKVRLERT